MPSSWLGVDAPNIMTGWGGPPELKAAPIGDLVSSILRNRQFQQEFAQKNIADAIKQSQEQRSNAAYIKAAQATGVLPAGDYSGMTAAEATALAKAIQDRTQTSQEKYYDELTNILKKTGTLPSRSSRAPSTKIWSDELGGMVTPEQAFQARKTQAALLGKQAEAISSEQEAYGLKPDVKPAAHGYVMKDGKLAYATTPEEQASPTLVSPGDPLTDPNAPTFTPDVYKQRETQSALRQKILEQQKAVQAKMLTPPTGGGGGGGGPHDQAISQANRIKADFQAGKITAEDARAAIQALGIPGLQ